MKLPTLSEQIIIEEIREEARAYGISQELVILAEEIWESRKDDKEFTLLNAYHKAFHQLIN